MFCVVVDAMVAETKLNNFVIKFRATEAVRIVVFPDKFKLYVIELVSYRARSFQLGSPPCVNSAL